MRNPKKEKKEKKKTQKEWEGGEDVPEGSNDGILGLKQGQLRERNIEAFHPIDILGGLWKGHSGFGKRRGAPKVGHRSGEDGLLGFKRQPKQPFCMVLE